MIDFKNTRRGFLELIGDTIYIIYKYYPNATKTRVYKELRLDFYAYKKYAILLLKNDFIGYDNNKKFFLKNKGLEYLEIYNKLKSYFED